MRDFRKLSAILDAAEAQYPDRALPAAYVGVFGNRVRPRFNFDILASKIDEAGVRPDVKLLKFETTRDAPDQPVISMPENAFDAGIRSMTASGASRRGAEQTDSYPGPVKDPLRTPVDRGWADSPIWPAAQQSLPRVRPSTVADVHNHA